MPGHMPWSCWVYARAYALRLLCQNILGAVAVDAARHERLQKVRSLQRRERLFAADHRQKPRHLLRRHDGRDGLREQTLAIRDPHKKYENKTIR